MLGKLIGLVLGGIIFPIFVFAAETSTISPVADCVVSAQQSYNDRVSVCLQEKVKVLERWQNLSYQEIQQAIVAVQAEQQKCYVDENWLNELKKRNAACYENAQFGGIWELPVLKQALVNQMADFQNLSPAKSQQLGACVENAVGGNQAGTVSSGVQLALSNCFTAVGLKGLGNVYEKISIVVDCAQTRWPIRTAEDAARVVTQQSPDDVAYLEQCVLARTAPVVVGATVANWALASGWRQTWLFVQFLITQPIWLLRRRRGAATGQVLDTATTDPVDLGSVRLLEGASGRVVQTLVTGHNGQYAFLPNPGEYRVVVDKPGYLFPSDSRHELIEDHAHYYGGPLTVSAAHEIIDPILPVDPHVTRATRARFWWGWWRRQLTIAVALLGPVLSLVAWVFTREWWVAMWFVAQVFLLMGFWRLTRPRAVKKFGVVTDAAQRPLAGVTVSLFRIEDNKLLAFYVTDRLGRYYFPRVVGRFNLSFQKKNFKEQLRAVEISAADRVSAATVLDVQLIT